MILLKLPHVFYILLNLVYHKNNIFIDVTSGSGSNHGVIIERLLIVTFCF